MFGRKVTAADSVGVIQEAGLDFNVVKLNDRVNFEGVDYEWDDVFTTFRTDTKKKLGTVGRVYQITQNRDFARFMDTLPIKYDRAGYLGHGERIFLSAKVNDAQFCVGQDEYNCYIYMINGHDGKVGIHIYPCANRRNEMIPLSQKNYFRIRHSGKTEEQVEAAMSILKDSLEIFEDYGDKLKSLLKPFSNHREFLINISAEALDVEPSERAISNEDIQLYRLGKVTKKKKAHIETVGALKRCYLTEQQLQPSLKDTAYIAYCAVVNWCNYGQSYRGSEKKRSDTKFNNLLLGKLGKLQSVALKTLLKEI